MLHHNKPIENGGGRGGQIFQGVKAAAGDVIAVVHADASVRAPVFSNMLGVLNKNSDVIGGAAGSVFNIRMFRLKLIELANAFRMVFLGISFGDQVQFFRRRPVVNAELYPDIPLMEDVELSIRLHRLGRQVFMFDEAVVSARRWHAVGSKNSFNIVCMLASYLIKRLFKRPDTVSLYKNYYGKA